MTRTTLASRPDNSGLLCVRGSGLEFLHHRTIEAPDPRPFRQSDALRPPAACRDTHTPVIAMAQAVSSAFKAAPARAAAPRRARSTHIVCARQGEAPLVRKGFPPRRPLCGNGRGSLRQRPPPRPTSRNRATAGALSEFCCGGAEALLLLSACMPASGVVAFPFPLAATAAHQPCQPVCHAAGAAGRRAAQCPDGRSCCLPGGGRCSGRGHAAGACWHQRRPGGGSLGLEDAVGSCTAACCSAYLVLHTGNQTAGLMPRTPCTRGQAAAARTPLRASTSSAM